MGQETGTEVKTAGRKVVFRAAQMQLLVVITLVGVGAGSVEDDESHGHVRQ